MRAAPILDANLRARLTGGVLRRYRPQRDFLALLNLGAAEVFGAMVLAQPMARPIARLEAALAHPSLTTRQRRKGEFFLGKAHQSEQPDAEADRHFRRILPAWARFAYPLVRDRLRSFP